MLRVEATRQLHDSRPVEHNHAAGEAAHLRRQFREGSGQPPSRDHTRRRAFPPAARSSTGLRQTRRSRACSQERLVGRRREGSPPPPAPTRAPLVARRVHLCDRQPHLASQPLLPLPAPAPSAAFAAQGGGSGGGRGAHRSRVRARRAEVGRRVAYSVVDSAVSDPTSSRAIRRGRVGRREGRGSARAARRRRRHWRLGGGRRRARRDGATPSH